MVCDRWAGDRSSVIWLGFGCSADGEEFADAVFPDDVEALEGQALRRGAADFQAIGIGSDLIEEHAGREFAHGHALEEFEDFATVFKEELDGFVGVESVAPVYLFGLVAEDLIKEEFGLILHECLPEVHDDVAGGCEDQCDRVVFVADADGVLVGGGIGCSGCFGLLSMFGGELRKGPASDRGGAPAAGEVLPLGAFDAGETAPDGDHPAFGFAAGQEGRADGEAQGDGQRERRL